MRKLLIAGFTLVLSVPALALAQNTVDGTWKTDPASIHAGGKPIIVSLKDGTFSCNCDNPAISVKADGKDHAVSGHPSYDMLAVEVVNDHSLHMIEKKAGKTVSDGTITTSADGNTIVDEFTDTSGTSTVTGKAEYVRQGKAAPGANMTAGTWMLKNVDNVSDNDLTFTYKIDGDTVNYSNGVGDSYTATFGGKAAPLHDAANSHTSIAVRKAGKNGISETFTRDGKVIGTDTLTLSADGKSLTVVEHNLRTGRSGSSTANRQ